jgi:predicted nicotinamide N-methyase
MALVVYVPTLVTMLRAAEHSVYIGGVVNRSFAIGQSGSGTGSILWPAAELLSQYIAAPGSEAALPIIAQSAQGWSWKDRTVLELGSGLGLLTATLISLGATVVATDGEADVVDQLDCNIAANFSGEDERRQLHVYSSTVFRWGSETSELVDRLSTLTNSEKSHFDIVIASDIIYGDNEVAWSLLVQNLVDLMDLGDGADFPATIMIGQSERYKEKEDIFYEMMMKHFELLDAIDLSGFTACSVIPDIMSKSRLYIYRKRQPVER